MTRSAVKKDPLEFRKPYQEIIRNLINNINICNRQYVKTGNEGYMVMRAKYVEEVEELKTFIKKEELRLGYYDSEGVS